RAAPSKDKLKISPDEQERSQPQSAHSFGGDAKGGLIELSGEQHEQSAKHQRHSSAIPAKARRPSLAPRFPKQVTAEHQHHPAELKLGIVRPEPARPPHQPQHGERRRKQAEWHEKITHELPLWMLNLQRRTSSR